MLILAVTDQFSPFCSYNYQNISQKMVAGCMECQQYNEERLQCTIKVIIKRQTARRKLHALAGDVVAKYSSCVRELCLYKCVCVGGGVCICMGFSCRRLWTKSLVVWVLLFFSAPFCSSVIIFTVSCRQSL